MNNKTKEEILKEFDELIEYGEFGIPDVKDFILSVYDRIQSQTRKQVAEEILNEVLGIVSYGGRGNLHNFLKYALHICGKNNNEVGYSYVKTNNELDDMVKKIVELKSKYLKEEKE